MTMDVTDNRESKRFEAALDGHTAVVEYNLTPGRMLIAHTEVPQAIEGRGIASRMYAKVLETAKAEDLVLVPVCPVFAMWLRRHPEAHPFIDPGFLRSLGLVQPPG
jgi:hypothetical protein